MQRRIGGEVYRWLPRALNVSHVNRGQLLLITSLLGILHAFSGLKLKS